MQNVKTPPRSPSPDDWYFTEADRFEMVNTGLFYNYVYVRELDDIWSKYGENELWDLRFGSISYIHDNHSSL